jgi:hypothetical protein
VSAPAPIVGNPSVPLREAEGISPRDTTKEWVQLVRGEYLEMPGLRLTRSQVQRLWGLANDECDAVICELIAAGFLRRTPGGAYIRADIAQA